MKDKRIIAYKSKQVKKIAFSFRELLKKVVMQEWNRLGDKKREKNNSQAERIRIDNERSSLYRALEASICECPGCNQTEREMVYNAPLKGWYCTTCVQEYREFYYKNKTILDQGGFVGDFDEDFHESFL